MAKHVFLIRHAKSDWEDGVGDFDRPLALRGLADASQMASRLVKYGIQPQQLVSSPANRAITTARIFGEQLGVAEVEIVQDERIYGGSIEELLAIFRALDNRCNRVALFGHNPDISALVYVLGEREQVKLPPCGLVHLCFDRLDDWTKLDRNTGKKMWFARPGDKE